MPFDTLGPYKLGRKIGQGGMGAVYEAVDEQTGDSVAVKVLSAALAAESGFRVRFEAEIESLKKLQHPNIVRLYGYGEQEGVLFYGMERVVGANLEEELRAGRRFEWREVTQLSIQVCRALKHAHDHGVIHRDIKPANLLLTSNGEVKLTDFGIARLFGDTRLTADGGVLGTAEYMSPEQAEGKQVTNRCDQYSLGGVMYALLAGRPPFRAGSLVEMLQLQRFSEPLPLRRFAPDAPAELERIVMQLLAKDPQKRFANMLLIARSLEAMERGLSVESASDDFVLADGGSSVQGQTGYDPFAATLVPSETPAPPSDKTERPLNTRFSDQPTAQHTGKSAPTHVSTTGVSTTTSRFTKVEGKTQRRRTVESPGLAGLVSLPTLLMAAGFLAILLAAWLGLRPTSADVLYERIKAAATSGADELLTVDDQIKEFLKHYRMDSRADEVSRYLRDNQLEREQNRFRRLAKGRGKQEGLSPVERDYVDALRLSLADPGAGLEKMQSFLRLNEHAAAADDSPTQLCVELARRQMESLGKQIQEQQTESLAMLRSRIDKANELKSTDLTAAQEIWREIVDQYADKRWADEAVAAARRSLDE